MSFILDTATFTAIHAHEKAVEGLKGEAKENTAARNNHKIEAYSGLIAHLAGVKLVKGNLPRAIGNQVRAALLEDAGLKEPTAKRYMENSVGALRVLDIPTQATADLVKNILLAENIDSENKLAKLVSGEADKDPMRELAEALVGKWTTRKDDDGNKVRGVFKPSKHEQEDWDRFDDIVRELKAARIEGAKAAADAEDDEAQKNALANAVFAQM